MNNNDDDENNNSNDTNNKNNNIEYFYFNKEFFDEVSRVFRIVQRERIKEYIENDYYDNTNEKNKILNRHRINRLFNQRMLTVHFCCNQIEEDFLKPIICHFTESNYIQKFFDYKITKTVMQTYAIVVVLYLYYALAINEQTFDFLYISDFAHILGAHKYKIVVKIIESFYIGRIEEEDAIISQIRRMILGFIKR